MPGFTSPETLAGMGTSPVVICFFAASAGWMARSSVTMPALPLRRVMVPQV